MTRSIYTTVSILTLVAAAACGDPHLPTKGHPPEEQSSSFVGEEQPETLPPEWQM